MLSVFIRLFGCLDSPKDTHALVSPLGDIREGSYVNLSCVSHANPPAYRYQEYFMSL